MFQLLRLSIQHSSYCGMRAMGLKGPPIEPNISLVEPHSSYTTYRGELAKDLHGLPPKALKLTITHGDSSRYPRLGAGPRYLNQDQGGMWFGG